jgi:hypothetical protein
MVNQSLAGHASWLPAITMDGEWHSSTPGGREVIVQRRGELWLVRCGDLRVLNRNLDVALLNAIRADHETVAHSDEADYPAWARAAADEIDSGV